MLTWYFNQRLLQHPFHCPSSAPTRQLVVFCLTQSETFNNLPWGVQMTIIESRVEKFTRKRTVVTLLIFCWPLFPSLQQLASQSVKSDCLSVRPLNELGLFSSWRFPSGRVPCSSSSPVLLMGHFVVLAPNNFTARHIPWDTTSESLISEGPASSLAHLKMPPLGTIKCFCRLSLPGNITGRSSLRLVYSPWRMDEL